MPKRDIAQIWETSLQFIYDSRYVDSLDALLREHNVKRVLDASCGVGFPAIELRKRGYDVTCTDADELMLARFRRNCVNDGVRIEPKKLSWSELAEHFQNEFDFVLCRGNSLPYAASWGRKKMNAETAKAEICKAIENFHAVLKPCGILYIDLQPRESSIPQQISLVENFGEKRIGGKTIGLCWRIRHDLVKRERIWSPEVVVKHNGLCTERFAATYRGYHLKHSELLTLLANAGFRKIEQYVNIPGEENYDVFLAHK